MGLQIVTGGGAGQFGAGMGKGLNDGIQAEQERQRQAAEAERMAEDWRTATKAALKPLIDRQSAMTPDTLEKPGAMDTTRVPMGKFGSVDVPSYMRPTPNPEQQQLDELTGVYAKQLQGMTDPTAMRAYAQGAAQDLENFQRMRAVRNINNTLKAGVKSGAMDPDEAQFFMDRIANGDDSLDVYRQLDEFKREKSQRVQSEVRVNRYIENATIGQNTFLESARATNDSEEAQWLTAQAGRMADVVAELQTAVAFGLDDFDFESAVKMVNDVKYALNPYQQQRQEEQMQAQAQQYKAQAAQAKVRDEAIARILTDPDLVDDRDALIEALKKEFGSAPAAQPRRGGQGGGQQGQGGGQGGAQDPYAGTSTPLLGEIYRAGPGSFGTTLKEVRNNGEAAFYGAAQQVAEVSGYKFPKGFSAHSTPDQFIEAMMGLVEHLSATKNEDFARSFAGTMADGIELWDSELRKLGEYDSKAPLVDEKTQQPLDSMDPETPKLLGSDKLPAGYFGGQ